MTTEAITDWVGPVLEAGETARALVNAIRVVNPRAVTQDRGSYVRVLAPSRCVLRVSDAERELGRPFHLPVDLEAVMPSFKGFLRMSEGEAVWSFEQP